MKTKALFSAVVASALIAVASAADPAPAKIGVVPVAALKGPAWAKRGELFWLDTSGTVSDRDVNVTVARGPERVKVLNLYVKGADGAFTYYGTGAIAQKVGTYQFVNMAVGPVPAAPAVMPYDTAFWELPVLDDSPQPNPVPPPPGPGPPPAPLPPPTPPQPGPGPVPAGVKLTALAVYSGDTASADEVAFSAVRDATGEIQLTLAAMNVAWFCMDRRDPRLAPFVSALPPAGPSPVMFLYATGPPSVFYGADGHPLSAPAPFPAPLTRDGVVALAKKIRGSN